MTGGCRVTQADRARWQRQAAGELAAILGDCGGLPLITWAVGPAGPVLAGRVNGLARAERVREAFNAWRTALALQEHHGCPLSGGASWLHAAARRHQVMIRLTATVFDGEEGGK